KNQKSIRDKDQLIATLQSQANESEKQLEEFSYLKQVVQQRNKKIEELFQENKEKGEHIQELQLKLRQSEQTLKSTSPPSTPVISPSSLQNIAKFEQQIQQLQKEVATHQETEKKLKKQ